MERMAGTYFKQNSVDSRVLTKRREESSRGIGSIIKIGEWHHHHNSFWRFQVRLKRASNINNSQLKNQ